jgi:hypothetical protein
MFFFSQIPVMLSSNGIGPKTWKVGGPFQDGPALQSTGESLCSQVPETASQFEYWAL